MITGASKIPHRSNAQTHDPIRSRFVPLFRRTTQHDLSPIRPSSPPRKVLPATRPLPRKLSCRVHLLPQTLGRVRPDHPKSGARAPTRPRAHHLRSPSPHQAATPILEPHRGGPALRRDRDQPAALLPGPLRERSTSRNRHRLTHGHRRAPRQSGLRTPTSIHALPDDPNIHGKGTADTAQGLALTEPPPAQRTLSLAFPFSQSPPAQRILSLANPFAESPPAQRTITSALPLAEQHPRTPFSSAQPNNRNAHEPSHRTHP